MALLTAPRPLTRSSRSVDVPRLARAVEASRRGLAYYREQRFLAVKDYVGAHYSEGGRRQIVPVNLLDLYVQTVGRSLVPKSPRVMLSTFSRPDKPSVKKMQDWANREIEDLYLAEKFRRWVVDALFSVGVMKCALTTPSDAAAAGYNRPAGTPYCCPVDLDDFVADLSARSFEEVAYIGHRYRVPLETVRDSRLYGRGRLDLVASERQRTNEGGDERISEIGEEGRGYDEEFEDMVELWDIYVPRKKLTLTLASDDGGSPFTDREPLRAQEWVGPDCGPYHVLGFGTVPGNLMPKSRVMDLIDLHLAVNECYRKLLRQTERQKQVTMVAGGADQDGNRVMNASDGQMIRVDNPERIRNVDFGGPNNVLLAMAVHLRQLFNFMGGGLDILGGRSPASGTATQDKILNENASAGVQDMQAAANAGIVSVLKAMCWYWWHDPFKVMEYEEALPGLPDISAVRRLTPADRQRTPWKKVDVRVNPYSLQSQTPQQRLAQLRGALQGIILPLMPILRQQGAAFDANRYLQLEAEYGDNPDLAEIVAYQEPPEDALGGGGEQPSLLGGAPTERRYVRESRSEKTGQGQDEMTVNSLMGMAAGGGQDRNGMPRG